MFEKIILNILSNHVTSLAKSQIWLNNSNLEKSKTYLNESLGIINSCAKFTRDSSH